MLQDIRYALRGLIRAPGFAIVAILTLALGIGANTAIFSLIYAVILKPLPYRDPGKLIVAWDAYQPQFSKLGVSPLELEAWQRQTDLFQQTAWYRYVPKDLAMTGPGPEAFEVHAALISPKLLPLMGGSPALGRAFAEKEIPASILLSHRVWQSRFGANPAVTGKAVRLNDREFTIAGVMPPDFQFPEWADVWLPEGPLLGDELTNPVRHALGFVARLQRGATLQQAQARLETISARLALDHPKTSTGFSVGVSGLQDDLTASVRPALLMLLGAVALVLVIVCANIANLLLARASGRAREMAVRIALGAGAWRIVRQLLTESVVLAILGGAAGLVLARASLTRLAPVPTPLDSTVLLFLLVVSVGNGVAFGLAPALHALRANPNVSMKPGSTGTLREALVVLEIALAVVLVVGSSILGKSFWRMMHVDPGFSPHGVLTLRISVRLRVRAMPCSIAFKNACGRYRPSNPSRRRTRSL